MYVGGALVAVLVITLIVTSKISDSRNAHEKGLDVQARTAAISAQLKQLAHKTNGAVTLDGTFDADGDWNGKAVKLKFNVSHCHQVNGYAITPKRPAAANQVVIHVLVLGVNANAPAADMPLRDNNDGDLFELKDTLQNSGLKQCVTGDSRMFPLDG
jgi:hypothetical protein